MAQLPSGSSKIRAKLRWGIVAIAALFVIAAAYDAPAVFNRGIDAINNTISLGLPHIPAKPFSLGLDLQGGAHLTYRADVTTIAVNDRGPAVEGVRDVIERRVNALGVSESAVQTAKVGDEYRVIIEMPGVKDINQAIKLIGDTPALEFREPNTVPPRELTADEKKQLDLDNAAMKTRADEALAKIKGDTSFENVSKEYAAIQQSVGAKFGGRGVVNTEGYIGYTTADALPPAWSTWVTKAKEGDISPVIADTDGYAILKLGKTREGELSVKASHILVCYLGAERCTDQKYTKEEAKAKAQEIFDAANASNFAALAKEHSTDLSNNEKGGDLGFFPRSAMVPEFAEPAFTAKVGEIIGPVETPFGYHIIYKTDEKKNQEYELSALSLLKKTEIDVLPPQDPFMPTGLTGSQLERAEVVTDPTTGAAQVSIRFNSEGTELFRVITERNVNNPIAIFLDGEIISAPTVNEPITDGQAVISGKFSLDEARLLTQRLNAGALPVPVELISQQTVGATLGAESLQKSLKAGIVGVLLVMIFIVLYYRLPGVVAVLALGLYIALTLAFFKLIGVTLTLAGIAGLILSIGMALDANVLIFERLKEELQSGKSLKLAVEEGFLRAWPSIKDSNIATLVTCIVMIWLGSSFVKGFAATLFIGVLMSMFTAITVTRALLRFIVPWFKDRLEFFLGGKKQNAQTENV